MTSKSRGLRRVLCFSEMKLEKETQNLYFDGFSDARDLESEIRSHARMSSGCFFVVVWVVLGDFVGRYFFSFFLWSCGFFICFVYVFYESKFEIGGLLQNSKATAE